MYKVICESCLWLPGVESTAEPHTDKTLDKTPANICRKLETKFLSQCYVQLEERVMFPQSEPWSAICLFPSSFQRSNGGISALLGTCACSCSSSLVENAVRQCGGTSISATILWIWLLMLSHSSALKNCSKTRKPSLWNWKRRGDCSSPEPSGEAAQSKRKQFWPFTGWKASQLQLCSQAACS